MKTNNENPNNNENKNEEANVAAEVKLAQNIGYAALKELMENRTVSENEAEDVLNMAFAFTRLCIKRAVRIHNEEEREKMLKEIKEFRQNLIEADKKEKAEAEALKKKIAEAGRKVREAYEKRKKNRRNRRRKNQRNNERQMSKEFKEAIEKTEAMFGVFAQAEALRAQIFKDDINVRFLQRMAKHIVKNCFKNIDGVDVNSVKARVVKEDGRPAIEIEFRKAN